jgi:hypothetical protein
MGRLRIHIPKFVLLFLLCGGLFRAAAGLPAGSPPAGPGQERPDSVLMTARQVLFTQLEDSLKVLAMRIVESPEDSIRQANNGLFAAALERALREPGAFAHPFDSLQTVSFLEAPNGAFRIITWYVPLQGQRFDYHGLIQLPEEAGGRLIPLRDASGEIRSAVFSELSADTWYGAWYYEILHHESGGEDLFTLLGWKGDNPHTRKRVIEPLWFLDGEPVFGRQVFRVGERDPFRVVFEYSAMVSMGLLHATHPLREGEAPREMILFDRLSPGDESLRGHYRFYVPEGNILDAFVFEEGRWVFYRDVDARGPQLPGSGPD